MAIFNEILSARFANSLKKLLSMKGEAPAKQLAGEIIPVFTFGAETAGHRFLSGWNLFASGVQQPAVAGNLSAVRYRNPANSRVLVEVLKWDMFCSAADQLSLETSDGTAGVGDLATLTGSMRLDARLGGLHSNLIVSRDAPVASPALSGLWQIVVPINTLVEFLQSDEHVFPILPGDCVQVRCITVNETLTSNLMWRERPMEESELF